ncbi:MAG: metallophosphoesterase, partial [Planctomycetaceae bacterium]|nr:metallophosphoesterase [Planctomycetaceae bacterium]
MDTIPFHCLMSALDIVISGFLIFWVVFNFKFFRKGEVDNLYYDYLQRPDFDSPQNIDTTQSEVVFGFRKLLWDLCGVVLCGVVLLFGLVFFAVVFRANFGQCVIEGLTFHVGLFLIFSGVLLFIRRDRIFGLVLFFVGLGGGFLGVDMLYIEPNSLVYEYYQIESAKIKSPLRIVFVADIQTDKIGLHERQTLQMIKEAKPDLILLGGDYLQYYEGSVGMSALPERFRQLFLEIPLEAPLGVYAIAGNIDYSSTEQFSVLFKDTTVAPIFFSEMIDGLGEDEGKGPIDIRFLSVFDSIDGVQQAALSSSNNFTVVIGHYPNYAIKDYQFSDQAPDLMLAGHTHGGQIYIPFWGALR